MLERWPVAVGVLLLGSCAAWGLGGSSELHQAHARLQTPSVPAPSLGAAASADPAPAPACPGEMALVDGTCVDRYEARLLLRGADGSPSPHPPFEAPPSGATLVAEARAGVKPQAYISQVAAAAACQNAGKRLCSLTEWHRACVGSAHTTYPYGARFEADRCNVGKHHLLSILHGADASAWSYRDFNDPKLDQRPGFLALTGEYAGCVSQDGAYDLVGNLHEWVADRVDASLRKKLPTAGVLQGKLGRRHGNGIFMGGFFSTLNQHGEGCDFITAAHAVRYHDYSTGFRCCKDG